MPEHPRRVAYVVTSTTVGGAERQVYELAAAFRRRHWGVGVVSMLPLHEQFLPLREQGVRLASLEMTKGIADPRALVRLARLLRGWRPDVVHGHMIHANLLTRLTRLLVPGPRVVSTMHNQDEGAQWRYVAYRLTDLLADVTTTVSPLAMDEAVRRHAASPRNITVVPNGLDTTRYAPDEGLRAATRAGLGLGDAFTWLSVGRLTEAKRHLDLIDAMRVVCERRPDARLLIAGVGPLGPALERRIVDLDLAANVQLLGLRGDVPALMQAADGFALSSGWEGLPMVLLEAAASSLPIVATDVGGSRDVVSDEETGYLAPAGQPDRLARQLLRLMALPRSDRQAMGRLARAHAHASFDLERIADRWEVIYGGR